MGAELYSIPAPASGSWEVIDNSGGLLSFFAGPKLWFRELHANFTTIATVSTRLIDPVKGRMAGVLACLIDGRQELSVHALQARLVQPS